VTGTRLGHYEITARLGAGGMGEVFRVFDWPEALEGDPRSGS